MNFFKKRKKDNSLSLFFVVTQIDDDVNVEYCFSFAEAVEYKKDFLNHFNGLKPTCSIFYGKEV
ncbi:hypothetical protein [Peromfec virus RodF8_60]|uniref:Uncharacterized protein n=1 Tax=Peromfec virus RodF8_60 TaxID=2929386 RepID=A0A976R7N7_9VIRU|nr:hypothetical protein [Peromfec virus RodF8_60]